MIKSCRSCSKYSSCEKACPKVEETLEKVYKYNKYGPEIVVTQLLQSNGKGKEINLSIDDARKIDPGQLYGDTTDTEIEWDRQILPTLVDWNVNDIKSIKKRISNAIPLDNKKQRRRFNDFLHCTTMSKIAEKANTSKQNIQKQFQATVNRIYKTVPGSSMRIEQKITPHKFKEKLT
jgi:hypothetical protein